jgi:methylthioribose-1-phosphate isomerase
VIETVRWKNGRVRYIDQRLLPGRLEFVETESLETLAEAIETLAIRGAPAIGVAAAYGVALAARLAAESGADMKGALAAADARLRRTRPTAVNLFWALERMAGLAARELQDGPQGGGRAVAARLLAEAEHILEEDLETSRRIGIHGLALLKEGSRILTHCNAGGLATGGLGTALAPVYAAKLAGKAVEVFADETRPLLQGARLTAWEMAQSDIPVTLLCDGASASLLASGRVDLVIVGADRVARNGDTANKIGTLAAALAARQYGVPFYVAAPLSTFDPSVATGADIPIEERAGDEVTGTTTSGAPEGIRVYNPAFDVTPAELIAGHITERGILKPPFDF